MGVLSLGACEEVSCLMIVLKVRYRVAMGNFFPKPDLAFKAFAVYCGKLLRVKQGVVT